MRKRLFLFALLLSAVFAVGPAMSAFAFNYYMFSTHSCTINDYDDQALSVSSKSNETKGYYYSDWGFDGLTRMSIDSGSITAQETTKLKFVGWYTSSTGWGSAGWPTVADCDKKITGEKAISAAQISGAGQVSGVPVVLAKYIPVYKITATVSPAGSGTASVSPTPGPYEEGSKVTLSATESNDAYKLAYWKKGTSKVSGSDGKLSLQITATADAAYTAYFTNKTYTVTFHDPSATFSDEVQTVTHGQPATAPSWSRTGYKSPTWDKSFSSVTATMTVNAQWTAEQYTVTFHDPSGVNADVVRTVSYGQSASAPSWSRTGYKSPTWDKSFSSVTANMTVNAQWTPETYTITYNGLKQGATNPNPTTYTIETPTITFQPPTAVTGFKFNGWNPASIAKGSMGNKTVTATYLETVDKPIVTPTLTYNGSQQACATTDSRIQASNNQKTVPGKYTATFLPKSGYCWSDGTVSEVSANWEIVNAEITGAKVVQSGSLTYTGEPQQAKVSTQAMVKGSQTTTWKYSKSAGSYAAAMPSFTDAGPHTVYFEVSAQYHKPAYGSFTVTINRAKTAEVKLSNTVFSYTGLEQGPQVTFTHCTEASGSVKRGTNVGTYKVKATPDDNYAWSDDGTGTKEFEWKIEEGYFTATVSAGEGGRGGSTFGYWTKQEAQTEHIYLPTRTGYQISGWTASGYVGETPTVSGEYVTIPARTAGNFTVTPTWTPITYTIAFDGNGGEGSMSSVQLAYDEPYEVPPCEFTKTGCEFQRWQVLIDNRAVTNYTPGVVVSNLTSVAGKVVTFKAEWTSYYTIAFDGNGATNTVMATQLVERDVTTNLVKNAYVRPGYGFLGWDDTQNKRRYEDGASVRNIADVGETNTLVAAWSTNSFTVVFFGNGGLGEMESQPFTYDVPQALRANTFIRPGYDFLGWTRDPQTAVEFADQAIVSNLTSAADGVVPLFARWSSTGSLTNPYSIAADCNKTDNAGVKLELTPDKAAWCTVVSNASDAVEGGNDQYVKLMPTPQTPTDGDVSLRAELSGSGTLSFYYKTRFYVEHDVNNFVFADGAEVFKAETNVIGWAKYTYYKSAAEKKTVEWSFHVGAAGYEDGDFACVDFIKWDPQPREALMVGVTFRLNDGTSAPDDIFTNITCEAGKAIGQLPVPVSEGRSFLGWMTTPDGDATVDATWIVPSDEDGTQLYAKWSGGSEPTPGEPVAVTAAGVADGVFALTIPTESGVDYGVWTNADLAVDSWGLMGEPQEGKGNPLEFKWTILPEFPQLFFRAHKVEYK